MDIDAQNAQLQELNDAKIQQIKAQRKLFGGIIKKGDPLYKNIINVILFALLFPCMIILELALGIKNLLIYVFESLVSLVKFTAHTIRRTKQLLIVNYYFVSNWIQIKSQLMIFKIRESLAKCILFITQKLKQARNFIAFFFKVCIYVCIMIPKKWIANKYVILKNFFNKIYKSLSDSVKKRVLQFTEFIISIIKFIILKIKQITLVVYQYMKQITLYLKSQVKQFSLCLWLQIKKISILFYDRIYIPIMKKFKLCCVYLFDQLCNGIIKLKNAISYYVPLILNFMKIKLQQFKEWIYLQYLLIKRGLKYLKNQFIYYCLKFIDYLLGKFKQLKQNVISPVNVKIRQILKRIKQLLIDLALKIIDITKLTLLFMRDEVLIRLKRKIVDYYKSGSNISYKIFVILRQKRQQLTVKIGQIYKKMRQNADARYEKLRIKMQYFKLQINLLMGIIFNKIKNIYLKIIDIAQKLSVKIGKIYAKMKEDADARYEILRLQLEYIKQRSIILKKYISKNLLNIYRKLIFITKYLIKKIKSFVRFANKQLRLFVELCLKIKKIIFKCLIKTIKYLIELQCKIILKFILSFRVFNPIVRLIDKIFDILFFILSKPYLLYYKLIYNGIDFFIYQIPEKVYNGIVYLLDKLKQLIVNLQRLIGLIFRQAKKVISIINQKFILPILAIVVGCYKLIKKAFLYVVQQFINFKDMIKYNYVLPAWASIRLFGVRIKHSFIKIKQKVLQTINYGINKLKLVCLLIKNQFILIKNKITNLIKLFVQLIKGLIQSLYQQIKLVYGLIIPHIIFIKNQIISIFKSLKQKIVNVIQAIKEIILAQCLIIKEAAITVLISMKELSISIKQSVIQQLKSVQLMLNNMSDQLKQRMIEIKIQIIQQMTQVKQMLIQQKNAIANQFGIIRQNIKMQGIQIKDNMVAYKNEIKLTIKQMFKRN